MYNPSLSDSSGENLDNMNLNIENVATNLDYNILSQSAPGDKSFSTLSTHELRAVFSDHRLNCDISKFSEEQIIELRDKIHFRMTLLYQTQGVEFERTAESLDQKYSTVEEFTQAVIQKNPTLANFVTYPRFVEYYAQIKLTKHNESIDNFTTEILPSQLDEVITTKNLKKLGISSKDYINESNPKEKLLEIILQEGKLDSLFEDEKTKALFKNLKNQPNVRNLIENSVDTACFDHLQNKEIPEFIGHPNWGDIPSLYKNDFATNTLDRLISDGKNNWEKIITISNFVDNLLPNISADIQKFDSAYNNTAHIQRDPERSNINQIHTTYLEQLQNSTPSEANTLSIKYISQLENIKTQHENRETLKKDALDAINSVPQEMRDAGLEAQIFEKLKNPNLSFEDKKEIVKNIRQKNQEYKASLSYIYSTLPKTKKDIANLKTISPDQGKKFEDQLKSDEDTFKNNLGKWNNVFSPNTFKASLKNTQIQIQATMLEAQKLEEQKNIALDKEFTNILNKDVDGQQKNMIAHQWKEQKTSTDKQKMITNIKKTAPLYKRDLEKLRPLSATIKAKIQELKNKDGVDREALGTIEERFVSSKAKAKANIIQWNNTYPPSTHLKTLRRVDQDLKAFAKQKPQESKQNENENTKDVMYTKLTDTINGINNLKVHWKKAILNHFKDKNITQKDITYVKTKSYTYLTTLPKNQAKVANIQNRLKKLHNPEGEGVKTALSEALQKHKGYLPFSENSYSPIVLQNTLSNLDEKLGQIETVQQAKDILHEEDIQASIQTNTKNTIQKLNNTALPKAHTINLTHYIQHTKIRSKTADRFFAKLNGFIERENSICKENQKLQNQIDRINPLIDEAQKLLKTSNQKYKQGQTDKKVTYLGHARNQDLQKVLSLAKGEEATGEEDKDKETRSLENQTFNQSMYALMLKYNSIPENHLKTIQQKLLSSKDSHQTKMGYIEGLDDFLHAQAQGRLQIAEIQQEILTSIKTLPPEEKAVIHLKISMYKKYDMANQKRWNYDFLAIEHLQALKDLRFEIGERERDGDGERENFGDVKDFSPDINPQLLQNISSSLPKKHSQTIKKHLKHLNQEEIQEFNQKFPAFVEQEKHYISKAQPLYRELSQDIQIAYKQNHKNNNFDDKELNTIESQFSIALQSYEYNQTLWNTDKLAGHFLTQLQGVKVAFNIYQKEQEEETIDPTIKEQSQIAELKNSVQTKTHALLNKYNLPNTHKNTVKQFFVHLSHKDSLTWANDYLNTHFTTFLMEEVGYINENKELTKQIQNHPHKNSLSQAKLSFAQGYYEKQQAFWTSKDLAKHHNQELKNIIQEFNTPPSREESVEFINQAISFYLRGSSLPNIHKDTITKHYSNIDTDEEVQQRLQTLPKLARFIADESKRVDTNQNISKRIHNHELFDKIKESFDDVTAVYEYNQTIWDTSILAEFYGKQLRRLEGELDILQMQKNEKEKGEEEEREEREMEMEKEEKEEKEKEGEGKEGKNEKQSIEVMQELSQIKTKVSKILTAPDGKGWISKYIDILDDSEIKNIRLLRAEFQEKSEDSNTTPKTLETIMNKIESENTRLKKIVEKIQKNTKKEHNLEKALLKKIQKTSRKNSLTSDLYQTKELESLIIQDTPKDKRDEVLETFENNISQLHTPYQEVQTLENTLIPQKQKLSAEDAYTIDNSFNITLSDILSGSALAIMEAYKESLEFIMAKKQTEIQNDDEIDIEKSLLNLEKTKNIRIPKDLIKYLEDDDVMSLIETFENMTSYPKTLDTYQYDYSEIDEWLESILGDQSVKQEFLIQYKEHTTTSKRQILQQKIKKHFEFDINDILEIQETQNKIENSKIIKTATQHINTAEKFLEKYKGVVDGDNIDDLSGDLIMVIRTLEKMVDGANNGIYTESMVQDYLANHFMIEQRKLEKQIENEEEEREREIREIREREREREIGEGEREREVEEVEEVEESKEIEDQKVKISEAEEDTIENEELEEESPVEIIQELSHNEEGEGEGEGDEEIDSEKEKDNFESLEKEDRQEEINDNVEKDTNEEESEDQKVKIIEEEEDTVENEEIEEEKKDQEDNIETQEFEEESPVEIIQELSHNEEEKIDIPELEIDKEIEEQKEEVNFILDLLKRREIKELEEEKIKELTHIIQKRIETDEEKSEMLEKLTKLLSGIPSEDITFIISHIMQQYFGDEDIMSGILERYKKHKYITIQKLIQLLKQYAKKYNTTLIIAETPDNTDIKVMYQISFIKDIDTLFSKLTSQKVELKVKVRKNEVECLFEYGEPFIQMDIIRIAII